MNFKKICFAAAALLVFMSSLSFAQDGFVVSKIRVEGLQRVNLSTVMNYLPIHAGQSLKPEQTGAIIDALYQTGFFSDVSLSRQGSVLIINVVERSTIGLIHISGNKLLKTKELMTALKQAGIAEGLAYDHATLSGMQHALLQQYYTLGRYDARVDTAITPESRNRVAINIKIDEGEVAKVQQINIIGNHAFKTKEIIKNFQLATPHWWSPLLSFFIKSDQYSRDKLDSDLDTLRSYYMDRGYLRFNIDSSEVTITPGRKDVYITIHITEGPVYTIKGFEVEGQTLGHQTEIENLISLKPGEKFSRRRILAIDDTINRFYGDKGYALAQVNVVPTMDDADRTVFLTFNVKPGERIYVRHINFFGNTRTSDNVLRRNTRQMEGGAYSLSAVDESKRLLNNLGYLDNIGVQMQPVPGIPDEVDLNYNVKETSSATASGQVGYSDAYGFMYGASITQNNFKGEGKSLSLGFNNSSFAQQYNLGYFNPYYTVSGISRGFNLYVQRVNSASANLAAYNMNLYGGSVNYRVPVSEYDYLNFSYGYEYMQLSSSNPSTQIASFLNKYGQHFNNLKVTAGWIHNSYDRAIFPTKGFNQYLGVEAGLPGLPDSLDYYKLSYNAKYYHPIAKGFIFNVYGDLGYGNGYGNLNILPFFKNFYGGGIGSVRGFVSNTLGPLDSLNNPLGGNVLADGSVNLIVPNPISEKIRASIFVDAGNIYQDSLNLSSLRYSTGVEIDWYSPLGPLQFALAKVLNAKPGDQLQAFNFSVGTSF